MIVGLDSSTDKPNDAQLAQAYAAGIRLWALYMATKPGVNLLSVASKADFDRIKAHGMGTLAFVSGWDDPVALKAQAAAWGVAICLDDEGGIRAGGSWVQPFLDASGAGHYGSIANSTVDSSRAPFKIAAEYPPGNPPQQSWPPGYTPPSVPHGWQCIPTHTEFGCTVDRGFYDDYFASLSRGVVPMINPPVTFDSPVVASLTWPHGGFHLLSQRGGVYTFEGAPYLGGADGKPYFAGRQAARLEYMPAGSVPGYAEGYVIRDTANEPYRYDGRPGQ